MSFRIIFSSLVALALATAVSGCGLLSDVDARRLGEGGGFGGAGGTGGAGGQGATGSGAAGGEGGGGGEGAREPVECFTKSGCPGADTDCSERTCIEGVCGVSFLEAGTACTGQQVCDGEGTCVECLDGSRCGTDEICFEKRCEPVACHNGELDGTETDVDCGGACGPCGFEQGCKTYQDCQTGHCLQTATGGGGAGGAPAATGQCAGCSNDTQCHFTAYCQAFNGAPDTCVPRSPLGTACTQNNRCLSNRCADGVCCTSSCNGPCQACNLPGEVGTCLLYDEGQNPGNECGADVCSGTFPACRCADGLLNGAETALDCGGVCGGCLPGRACEVGGDCLSKICLANDTCAASVCGDGVVNGNDQCDGDGAGNGGQTATCDTNCTLQTCTDTTFNSIAESRTDCGGVCSACPAGLLLSEVVVAPAGGELIELYNPTAQTLALGRVYLADFTTYYEIAQAMADPDADDFVARFPSGASIGPGETAVVAIGSAADFIDAYGFAPDFDLDANDAGAPALTGIIGMDVALDDDNEPIVAFFWDGLGERVEDLDYVVYGSADEVVDKTGVMAGDETYADDTAAGAQSVAAAPGDGASIRRCNMREGTETQAGGNGFAGADETSEDLAATWILQTEPTPGEACVETRYAAAYGDAANAEAFDTAVDGDGAALVTGFFEGTIDFGGGELTSAGEGDVFVVKLDADGDEEWAQRFGGAGFDEGFGVAVDGDDDVLITGRFSSASIDFGCGAIANTGNGDVFVAKLSGADGTCVWSVGGTGGNFDRGQDVVALSGGDAVVVGFFESSTFTLGGIEVTNAQVTMGDVFVARLAAADGTAVFHRSAGGSDHDQAWSVARDAADRIAVGGLFRSGSISFGTELTNAGDWDAFVATLDGADGDEVWALRAGGAGLDQALGIAVDSQGDVAVTGVFASDSIGFGATSLANAGGEDLFAVKLAGADGAELWAMAAGGTAEERGNGVVFDGQGNVVVAAQSSSASVSFGGVGDALLNPEGGTQVVLGGLAGADGAHLWSRAGLAADAGLDKGLAVAGAPGGDLVFAGALSSSSVDFNLPPVSLMTAGGADVFILRLARP